MTLLHFKGWSSACFSYASAWVRLSATWAWTFGCELATEQKDKKTLGFGILLLLLVVVISV